MISVIAVGMPPAAVARLQRGTSEGGASPFVFWFLHPCKNAPTARMTDVEESTIGKICSALTDAYPRSPAAASS
jgi:hypothetical protein